ncbi:hypothetical protein Cri9333_4829 (plasmid) [Crinalium epipsammum PCC 9333]|uniref:Uncharacterized protein n=1 Tax=Crinalium epipsammum PCC 9333 TaxID=1173022 RepID=K9W5Z4_9CYAN|nr:hypothetical protein [Crinalium epipsammum]AFZ15596.1 hypothetical protein Cri9333_4829 [Crinalium epipsammum PCC 9333]
MISNVILINSDQEDGIPLYSPFTGILSCSEDDSDFDSDGKHKDHSLVFTYFGGIGEFFFLRPDASEIVSAGFDEERDRNEDMVKQVIRIAEKISTRLKTEKNLNTLMFVQTGGENGMVVSCFEQGYLDDGQWYPLRC